MSYKKFLLVAILFTLNKTFAQTCDCGKEFSYIKNFMEKNYVGFNDKVKIITRAAYDKKVKQLEQLVTSKSGDDKCLLIISNYLEIFKDAHVSISPNFSTDAVDSAFVANREVIKLSDKQLAALKTSTSIEGIYYFKYDSSYKIAVVKSPTALREYVGIMISSKWPVWKPGMVKFEMKRVNADLMKGVLYTRNHTPRIEWYATEKNSITGDWQREGSKATATNGNEHTPVASKKLSDKTLYMKIGTFDASNGKRIDSMFKANKGLLDSMPYLVLDLRGNGGGADFAYGPIIPYIYTNPIKTIGIDVLSTDSTIAGWKNVAENYPDLPEETRQSLRKKVAMMEAGKGKLVNIYNDDIDTSFTKRIFPKKVIVLIDDRCASTTEQFLFAAKQSSKVTLAGNHTEGVLDYSNVRETRFSCLPYTLNYSTSRSRRRDAGQAIDNVGIKPDVYLKKGSDWIEEARTLLEGK